MTFPFNNETPGYGWIAIVSGPIGNLEDTTFRAVEALRNADLIAAEDTRRARILTSRFDISTRLISYNSLNEHKKTRKLIDGVFAGKKIALLTDAGTPSISDPGYLLVRTAVENGIEPIIVPGASALTFSIVASAFPSEKFAFHGFLPVKKGKRKRVLEEIGQSGMTAVIYEAPHRMGKLLVDIADVLGTDRATAVVREATKMHEEILRGTAGELLARCSGRKWRGECTVVIGRENTPVPTHTENIEKDNK